MKTSLQKSDPEMAKIILGEEKRQKEILEMIPSENYSSKAIREALGSVFTDKYAEGYPKKRYYQGNKYSDEVEQLAIDRAKKLFGVPHVNVQSYSGSPANAAVFFALLNPGDKIMGLALSSGGHLTHGHPKITFSGKYFNSVQYSVEANGRIDYEKLAILVKKEKPKLLISGTTAYPRILDFKKFGKMADSVGAFHLADVSHIGGLIVAGVHPDPALYADVVMLTTHKTMRGPRGAVLLVTNKGLTKDPEMGNKIDQAVFPGLQGGPHLNNIAAMAVCFGEAARPEFREYGRQVVANARVLAQTLIKEKIELVSGGTDNHLMVIDLIKSKKMGRVAAEALEAAGIVTNKNAVPKDSLPPFFTSGIRLGTPAITTRGMKEKEMKKIGKWVAEIINLVPSFTDENIYTNKEKRIIYTREATIKIKENPRIKEIAGEVKNLCQFFPR